MILSDISLRRRINAGQLRIHPMQEEQIQPASVDIRLGRSFLVPRPLAEGAVVRMDDAPAYDTLEADSYPIQPGQFVLATTMEYFALPDDLTAFVEGRSSIGRLGLFIQNAGWVDPGFEGEITLELFNASCNPILLHSGRRVGQLVFAQLDQKAQNPYRGKYQGQRGAIGSRIHQDLDLRRQD